MYSDDETLNLQGWSTLGSVRPNVYSLDSVSPRVSVPSIRLGWLEANEFRDSTRPFSDPWGGNDPI